MQLNLPVCPMVPLLEENPLRIGLMQERTPEPLILVIFGASGDLTARKLIPAVYNLKQQRRLPPELTIVGVARRDWSHDYFREQMRKGLEEYGQGVGAEGIVAGLCPGTVLLLRRYG
jgi:glucose-6-phosphate 1-dehydrogenase